MGHHRADTRASRGRSPVTHSTPPYPASQAGKRAAGKRAARPVAAPRSRAARRARGRAGADAAAPRPPDRAGSPHRSSQVAVPWAPVGPDPAGHRRPRGLRRRRRHGGRPAARRRRPQQAPGEGHAGQRPQWHRRRGHHDEARRPRPGRQPRLAARRPVRRGRRRRSYAAAEAQVKERNAALAELAKQAEQYAAKLKLNLWHLPVAGYHLTATFGEYGLWSSYHTGLDFAAPSGTPIYAVANGVDHLGRLRRRLRQQDRGDPR